MEETMEAERRVWIWEFVLKKCQDPRLIKEFWKALPLSPHQQTPSLRRMLLLKSLSFHLRAGAISDSTLQALLALKHLLLSPPLSQDQQQQEPPPLAGNPSLNHAPQTLASSSSSSEDARRSPDPSCIHIAASAGTSTTTSPVLRNPRTVAGKIEDLERQQLKEQQTETLVPAEEDGRHDRPVRTVVPNPSSAEESEGPSLSASGEPEPVERSARRKHKRQKTIIPSEEGEEPGSCSAETETPLNLLFFPVSSSKPTELQDVEELCYLVRVECTVRHLRMESDDWPEFYSALRKYWGNYGDEAETEVQMGEDDDNDGFIANVGQHLWNVLKYPSKRHSLISHFKSRYVRKKLQAFLSRTWGQMKPSRLEILAEMVAGGSYNSLGLQKNSDFVAEERFDALVSMRGGKRGSDCNDDTTNMVEEREDKGVKDLRARLSVEAVEREEAAGNAHTLLNTDYLEEQAGDNRVQHNNTSSIPETCHGKGHHSLGFPGIHLRETTKTNRQKRQKLLSVPSAKGIHFKEAESGTGLVGTPEVLKAQAELKDSRAVLHAIVNDPLPEALEIAEKEENRHALDCAKPQVTPIIDISPDSRHEGNENVREVEAEEKMLNDKVRRKSIRLMDRNPTACTIEWDESEEITESPNSPTSSRSVRLPATSTRRFSPLPARDAAMGGLGRRLKTKWSALEEETLKKEVARYGKGRWKFILLSNKDVFEGRTEVDLKDKWRNIEKREAHELWRNLLREVDVPTNCSWISNDFIGAIPVFKSSNSSCSLAENPLLCVQNFDFTTLYTKLDLVDFCCRIQSLLNELFSYDEKSDRFKALLLEKSALLSDFCCLKA